MKKLLSMFLAVVMLFVFSIGSFASGNYLLDTEDINENMPYVSTFDTVYVTLSNGRKIPVQIEERRYGDISIMESQDEIDYGSCRTVICTISNDDLNALAQAGEVVEYILKQEIAKIMVQAIKIKYGVNITLIPNFLTKITQAVVDKNLKFGYNGFKVTTEIEYKRVFYNAGGYYIDCWDHKNTRIITY